MAFSGGVFSLVAGNPVIPHGFSFACSAYTKIPFARILNIQILAAKWMSSFAMSLRSFLLSCGLSHSGSIADEKSGCIKESDLWRNTALKPFDNDIFPNSSMYGPVFSNHSDTHEFNPYIRATVPILSVSRNPFAICWRVITIVICAIQAISFRSWTHICHKVSETLSFWRLKLPAFADLNTSASISMKLRRIGYIASCKHVSIEPVKLDIEFGGSHVV